MPCLRMEGWLRKKGQHINIWRERYFVLREEGGEARLLYFRKDGDQVPRGSFMLGSNCQVGQVKPTPSKLETKRLYSFKIKWVDRGRQEAESDGEDANFDLDILSDDENDLDSVHEESDDAHAMNNQYAKVKGDKAVKRNRNFKRASLAVAGVAAIGVSVATMGLATPTVIAVGATAMGVGGAGMAVKSRKPTADAMVLAAESLETAEWWRNGIQQSISKATARAKNLRARRNTHTLSTARDDSEDGREARDARRRTSSTGIVPKPMATNVQDTSSWSGNSSENRWKFLRFSHGLRVMQPMASNIPEHPCLKVSTVANATSEEAFSAVMTLMTSNSMPWFEQGRVVDRQDDHTDIIYFCMRPMLLMPISVSPRDFCLLRYWRYEEDGSLLVCYQSTYHAECRPRAGYIRAKIHAGGYTITPPKFPDPSKPQALITHMLQMDPQGWIASSSSMRRLGLSAVGYWDLAQQFMMQMLASVVDVRDVAEQISFGSHRVDSTDVAIKSERCASNHIEVDSAEVQSDGINIMDEKRRREEQEYAAQILSLKKKACVFNCY